MKKFLYILAATIWMFSGCKKTDFKDNTPTGEGLVDFTLIAPSSGTILVLNAAIAGSQIRFSWNPAKPGLTTPPKYTVVFAMRTGGDLNAPLLEFPVTDTAGTHLFISQSQLDDALKNKGVATGATAELVWSVKATNNSTTILSSSTFFITITRFKDGASPFLLLSPSSTLAPQSINPNSTVDNYIFRWTKSYPASGGPAIKYKVLFAERKLDGGGNELPVNWNAPLFSINSDNSGADTLATVSYKRISDSLFNKGFTTLPVPVSLKWTVVATSGAWNQISDYVNDLVIIREIKMYIVGSATPNGWDASQAIRMIPDGTNFGVFYMYVKLVPGEMKFLNGQAFPPAPGAVDWGQDPASPAGTMIDAGNEANIAIATAGVYRITVDLAHLKYYIQTGRMGTVGDATPQSWNPPTIFPTQALSLVKTNQFLGVETFVAGGEFKLIDDVAFPGGGGPINQARDYGKGAITGQLYESGETNFAGPGAGRTRVIWDGTDPLNLKYDLTPATEMRVVGNGMVGVNDWDPPTSPTMTYSGNGKWTITLQLKTGKEIKFVGGNAWGAFDYEDNGDGGGTAPIIIRKVKWEGGGNFSTPGADGTYVIELDEHAQTVTIHP